MMRRSPALLAVLLAGALLAGACGGGSDGRPSSSAPTPTPDPRTRPYEMGLSSLPSRLTEESYADAFERAGEAGDLVLIQRTPPWAEMISGDLSDETVGATERELELAADNGLQIFFAIDITEETDGGSQLAGLPAELRGAGFDNEQVRQAFIAYAQYVVQNYHPKYLALGVEVNSYQQHHPEDFERFVVVYHEAYQRVKELSPETLVFPTFQYEELQGLLPIADPQTPQWHLISRFEPRLDVFAVSSFPSLVYPDAQLVPDSYYAALPLHSDRPILMSALGYASAPGPDGTVSGATEAKQADFVRRALDTAQQLQFIGVMWFVGQDPTFAPGSGLDPFRRTGLVRENGAPKEAWAIWEANAHRPLEPLVREPAATATPAAP
jgi:hypothetical protein